MNLNNITIRCSELISAAKDRLGRLHYKRASILLLILCPFVISLGSCRKFVEVNVPKDRITGSIVFKDITTAEAALLNIYAKMKSSDYLFSGSRAGISILSGNYADELIYVGSEGSSPEQEFFANNLIPSNDAILYTWNESYNMIYNANALLEGVERSSGISDANKNRLRGEALFLRAYIHFYLVNLFGNIPYVTSADYRLNSTIGKTTTDAVYDAIIADLKQAKTLIPMAYPTTDRARPNKSTVSAMLARAYLYTKNWSGAELESNEVITNSMYTWVNNIDQVFLKESSGTIWQLASLRDGDNTVDAISYQVTASLVRVLSDRLFSAFEAGDLRKSSWIISSTTPSGTIYLPYKYKVIGPTGTLSKEYQVHFRLEEQYLIRAEARAKQNNFIGAKQDLNKIRNRAGLGDTPAADTEPELSEAILKERRVELFTEFGHRFFDLKRTGSANTALSYKPNWSATDLLWPLPEQELLINPNLKPQNTGY